MASYKPLHLDMLLPKAPRITKECTQVGGVVLV